jgi:dihydrofolate synthase/folylpolyglutamate synthase
LETVSLSPQIILDGAHNPAGIRALANYIQEFYQGRQIWLIYGSMRDKSLDEISGILSPLANHVIVTNPGSHRAVRAEILQNLFEHSSVHIAPSVEEALSLAKGAAPEDVVFVTGSLILVGGARRLLVG